MSDGSETKELHLAKFTKTGEVNGYDQTIWELKLILVFYFTQPIPIAVAAELYDIYFSEFGAEIKQFRSTAEGFIPQPFTTEIDAQLRDKLIPGLYKKNNWGYVFDDGRPLDAFLFIFHSYKPKSQPGYSSFCRFEFPRDIEPERVRSFATRVAAILPFTSGNCGYVLTTNPDEWEAYDHMFAICQRYWGIEAWDQDVTVAYLDNRFKSVTWLTFLGKGIISEFPDAIGEGKSAVAFQELPTGVMFQTRFAPALIDRNRSDDHRAETALARALLPAQITEHQSFYGDAWTEENTMEWLYRFTN